MRLGDLDALKKAIDTIKKTGYDINEEPVEFVELSDLIKAIDNTPTVEAYPFEDELKNAITLLAEYCAHRACKNCQLHTDDIGCLFRCGYPEHWVEIMNEYDKEE